MKAAYYFPHYSNARTDPKIRRLIKKYGNDGYAAFFMTLEVLRDQTDMRYKIADIDLLADEFGVSEALMIDMIDNSGLFECSDGYFYSQKLIDYMQPYFTMKEQRSAAGKASAAKRKRQMNQQPLNDRSTTVQQSKVKESKVKESKLSKRESSHPTQTTYLDEIQSDLIDSVIMQQLSTSVLSESVKKMYLLRLRSNDFMRLISGQYHRMQLSQVRADAEFLAQKGWLDSKEKPDNRNANTTTISQAVEIYANAPEVDN